MDEHEETPVTALLNAVASGDSSAQDGLFEAIYSELHKIARSQMAGNGAGRTLQPTALLHEAYLKLFRQPSDGFQSRKHFFATAARAMRQLCVDDVRRRGRQKRGGGSAREPLDTDGLLIDQDPAETLAVHEALERLERHDPRKAELVTMRFFPGLTIEQCANALGVSSRTLANEWRFAKAWLHKELNGDAATLETETDS
jgi:RNA polymerase sigma factor (TIGR02999 family)